MNRALIFQCVGLSWWVVLPLTIIVVWVIGRIARRELGNLPLKTARGMLLLRQAAVVVLMGLLIEPVWTRVQQVVEQPAVAVVIDHSGSMALDDRGMSPSQRLDEAQALGLLSVGARPDAGAGLAKALTLLAHEMPELARAIAGPVQPGQEQHLSQRFHLHLTGIRRANAGLLGPDSVGVAPLLDLVERGIAALGAPLTDGINHVALAGQLVAVIPQLVQHAVQARAAQRAADTALVAGAEAGSPIARALGELVGRSRAQRARELVDKHVLPALNGRADVEIFALSDDSSGTASDLTRLRPDTAWPAQGGTDLAAPLTQLAREWSNRHVGAVLLLSDGRQSHGDDPAAVARALAARGAQVSTVVIGDIDVPRDAAIAGIMGPNEIFRGEAVHLDVRWRVSGFTGSSWDLVLLAAEAEVGRRSVHGDGSWQVSRFSVEATQLPRAGNAPVTFTARIEPHRETAEERQVRPGAGLLHEVWNGVGGTRITDFFLSGIAPRRPDSRTILAAANMAAIPDNTANRLRGWIVPLETGAYTFWITADDEAELWLGPSGTPYDRERVAVVPEWTNPEEWDRYAAQRSSGIFLRAGQPCYVEVLHKQGAGGGHCALGWQTPSNKLERPLPVSVLAPWGDANTADDPGFDSLPESSSANNSAEMAVIINEDPLRILVVDHHPRWDLRYVTSFFARDRRIDLVSHYRAIRLPQGLHDLLPSTQAELDDFDAVVVGDLAPGELTVEDQDRLAQFVNRRGGFLIAIAGPRGMPWGYSLGALAGILPIRSGAISDPPRRLRVVLGGDGQQHPVTRILDDSSLNQRLWSVLPALQWAATSVTAKPGTQVLLTSADTAQAPILVLGRSGAGRVAWMGTDETWRWRDRLGDRVHETLWTQLLRWGLGSRLRGTDRRLQVSLDRAMIRPGEAAEVRARVLAGADQRVVVPRFEVEAVDEHGRPWGGGSTSGHVSISGHASQAEDTGLWSYRLSDLAAGHWRITVRAILPAGAEGVAEADLVEERLLLVRARPDVEGVELSADPAALERIAQAGGGIAVGVTEVAELSRTLAETLTPRSSEQRTTWALAQSHLPLVTLLIVLVAEWWWRKRRGLP